MQTKKSDNFMSAFYPQKMQGGGKPKKPSKRVFFAVAPEDVYKSYNLIGSNNADFGSYNGDIVGSSYDAIRKGISDILEKLPVEEGLFDKWYEENSGMFTPIPTKESAKNFYKKELTRKITNEIYNKAQVINWQGSDKIDIKKPHELQNTLSEIRSEYGVDLSGIKNLKKLYGSLSGFQYLANNNFSDDFGIKEVEEKEIDDTFIKEAKQAAKISMATEGVPSEIVIISNDEDFRTKIPEVLKSNKGKNVEFGLLTHANDFLGVSKKDVNTLFSENMEEGCKLGLYSCYGLSQAGSTFPGVKNIMHNMGSTWKGFPRFRTAQEYKNLAGKSFGEVAYGIGKNLNYSPAKYGEEWVDTSRFATDEEKANFYRSQVRTQAEEEALRTLRRQAREEGRERPEVLPAGFDLEPYIRMILGIDDPELTQRLVRSTSNQQVPVIEPPLAPLQSSQLQPLAIPRRFQAGGPVPNLLDLLNLNNIGSAFNAFGQAGTQYGNLFNTGTTQNPFLPKQQTTKWEDLTGEEAQKQKQKLAQEMGLKYNSWSGEWSNDKGESYTNDQLLSLAKDKYSTQYSSVENWNKAAPFGALAYASMNLQDMENQELLNKKEKIQDYPVTKSTYAPKGFARQGGLMSQLIGTYGYRDDSPFRNASSLTIPGNNIDMSKTGKNLMLIPDKGEPVFARRYSGTYQFPKNVKSVLEVPVAQNGLAANLSPKEVAQQKQLDAVKWLSDWRNSQMGSEMLRNSTENSEEFNNFNKNRSESLGRLKDIQFHKEQSYHPTGMPKSGVNYQNPITGTSQTYVYPFGVESPTTILHETGHAEDFAGKYIPKSDKDLINSFRPKSFEDSPFAKSEEGMSLSKKEKQAQAKYMKMYGDPKEVRQLINQVRFTESNDPNRVYDPFTQKVTPEIFEQMKVRVYEREDKNPLEILKRNFTDDQLIQLFNTISANDDSSRSANIARQGGRILKSIKKYQNSGYVPPVGKSVVDYQVTDDPNWKKQDSKVKQTQKNINDTAKQIIANKKPSEYTAEEADIIERSTLKGTLKLVDQYKISRANEARDRGEFESPENFAESTSAIGPKMSLQQLPFVGERIPDWAERYLNPFRMAGDMASGLGQIPLNINQGNYGQAALNIGMPLLAGATAGIGARTAGQFANNLVNPFAGLGSSIVKGGRLVRTLPYRLDNATLGARSYVKTPSREDFLVKSRNLAKIEDIMNPYSDLGKEAFERQKMESLQFWDTPEGRRRVQRLLDEEINPYLGTDYKPSDFVEEVSKTTYVPKADSARRQEMLSSVLKESEKLAKERRKLDKIMQSPSARKLSEKKQKDIVDKGYELAKRERFLEDERMRLGYYSENNAYYDPPNYEIGLGRYYNTPEASSSSIAHEWGHNKSGAMYPKISDYFRNSEMAQRPINVRARAVLGPNNWSFIPNGSLKLQPHLRPPTEEEISRSFRGMKSPYSSTSISGFLNPGNQAIRSRNYFLSGDEPAGFLGESLDYLLRQNFIRNQGDKININILEDAIDKYRRDRNLKPQIRIFDFINTSDKGQLQYLSDELNDFTYQNQNDSNVQYARQGGSIYKMQNGGGSELGNLTRILNPKNWFVKDYTKSGDFDTAFEAAKRAGEEEFIWNNKRYSTKSDLSEEAQMKVYGITDAQRKTIPTNSLRGVQKRILKGADNLSKINTNLGYDIPLKNLFSAALGRDSYLPMEDDTYIDWKHGNVSGGPKPRKKMYTDFSDEPDTALAKEQDALRLYLGLPQRYQTFAPSRYKKGAFELIGYNELLPETMPNKEEVKKYGHWSSDEDEGDVLKPYGNYVMGKHTVRTGKDEKGDYLEYIDKFDFDTYGLAGRGFDLVNKPFEIYGRKYYKDYGDGVKRAMYFSDKELMSLDPSNKNFDTLALQRELLNRGYSLPQSTTKDQVTQQFIPGVGDVTYTTKGKLDGILGEETINALLDWQSKNKKQVSEKKQGGRVLKSKSSIPPVPKPF